MSDAIVICAVVVLVIALGLWATGWPPEPTAGQEGAGLEADAGEQLVVIMLRDGGRLSGPITEWPCDAVADSEQGHYRLAWSYGAYLHHADVLVPVGRVSAILFLPDRPDTSPRQAAQAALRRLDAVTAEAERKQSVMRLPDGAAL